MHHLGKHLLDVLRPMVSQGMLRHQLDRVGEDQRFLLHLTDQPLTILLIAKVRKTGHHQGDGKKQQESETRGDSHGETYPFSPPMVSPRMNCRCTKRTMTITGSVIRVDAA